MNIGCDEFPDRCPKCGEDDFEEVDFEKNDDEVIQVMACCSEECAAQWRVRFAFADWDFE